MPSLEITINVPLSADEQRTFLAKASKTVAEIVGKPEAYVLTALNTAAMSFGGSDAPTALLKLSSIGRITPELNKTYATKLTELLGELGVDADRVFINFIDVAASHWGWNANTFA